jgi:hypothetical protein
MNLFIYFDPLRRAGHILEANFYLASPVNRHSQIRAASLAALI